MKQKRGHSKVVTFGPKSLQIIIFKKLKFKPNL